MQTFGDVYIHILHHVCAHRERNAYVRGTEKLTCVSLWSLHWIVSLHRFVFPSVFFLDREIGNEVWR